MIQSIRNIDGPMRRLLECANGIAMVEFALFVPIMIAILFGSITAFDAYRAGQRVTLTADTIADLISRRVAMDDQARDLLFTTATALLGRFSDANAISLTMTNIVNDDGEIEVLWSEAKGKGEEIDEDDLIKIALPTIPDGESIILVSVTTQYSPLLISSIFDRSEFSNSIILRPRFTAYIEYGNNS